VKNISDSKRFLTYYQVVLLTLMALTLFYKYVFNSAAGEAVAKQNTNNIIQMQQNIIENEKRIVDSEKAIVLYNLKMDGVKEDIVEIKELLKTMKK